MRFEKITRGGSYLRVADPSWKNPLDGSYARDHGGRWNSPGSFDVVYLCATLRVARAIVRQKLEGQPYGPEDLDPDEAPVLATAEIHRQSFVDLVTDKGCAAAGLSATYPRRKGQAIGWGECQPIGLEAWQQGESGIACRSAAPAMKNTDEELALFPRGESLEPTRRQTFPEWFWPA